VDNFSGFSIIGVGAARSADLPELVPVTSSFELKYASAVLRQVGKLFSAGFVRSDAEELRKEIDALEADQPKVWRYTVVYRGASYPLQVRAELDDLGMLDLDFFTVPQLAPPVRRAVDGYLNAHGL
jgi:hypothetical protein